MEQRIDCDYLDFSKKNASDMLLNCINDPSKGYDLNCNNLTNYENSNSSFVRGKEQGFNNPIELNNKEGFTNFYTDNGPGVSNVPFGQCPDGYTNKDGICVQVCTSCKYRDFDDKKSKIFNEADPCFPEGVYDGVTNDGSIKCTCGFNDKYCSEKFTDAYMADGVLFQNNNIKNNIGVMDHISKLFYFEQL